MNGVQTHRHILALLGFWQGPSSQCLSRATCPPGEDPVCEDRGMGSRPRRPRAHASLEGSPALQSAGDVQGGSRGSAALLLPRTAKAPSEHRRDDCYQLPIAREDIYFLASWEDLARHEDALLQVCARLSRTAGARRCSPRPLGALATLARPGPGQPSPQRPPPLDRSARLAAPTSSSVCSRVRWSVWTWSGDRLSARAAGPRCHSCRWPWQAVCSCWTCPGSRVPQEGRRPRPSPSWCPGCSQTPPSPSWVSSTRPCPSPAGPGEGCETGLSLGPRHSGAPQLQVMGWRGTCGAWVRPTQPWRRPCGSCRGAWTCCRRTDRSVPGVGWGLPAPCSTELPARQRLGNSLTEDLSPSWPSPDPWPQVTRDPDTGSPRREYRHTSPHCPGPTQLCPCPQDSQHYPGG